MRTARDGTYTLIPTAEGPLESVGRGWTLNGEAIPDERAEALRDAAPSLTVEYEAGSFTWDEPPRGPNRAQRRSSRSGS
jgi:hypothetical protein